MLRSGASIVEQQERIVARLSSLGRPSVNAPRGQPASRQARGGSVLEQEAGDDI